jgi:hypothetical protein
MADCRVSTPADVTKSIESDGWQFFSNMPRERLPTDGHWQVEDFHEDFQL